MSRTARVRTTLDRTMDTMDVYRRLLNVQASLVAVNEEHLFKGIHAFILASMASMIKALEAKLPKDMVAMAKEDQASRGKKAEAPEA